MKRTNEILGNLDIQRLEYSYSHNGRGFRLEVGDFNLRVGEIAVLHGPSGCGKTTFLNLIAGVLRSELNRTVRQTFPVVAYVMHETTLLPWLCVRGHIRVQERLRGRLCDIESVIELLGTFGMSRETLDSRTGELSLGMRQRTEIAIALGFDTTLLLLDEGLSGIDLSARLEVIRKLRERVDGRRLTVVGTSHNVVDTMRMADRVWRFAGGTVTRGKEIIPPAVDRQTMNASDLLKLAADYGLGQ